MDKYKALMLPETEQWTIEVPEYDRKHQLFLIHGISLSILALRWTLNSWIYIEVQNDFKFYIIKEN